MIINAKEISRFIFIKIDIFFKIDYNTNDNYLSAVRNHPAKSKLGDINKIYFYSYFLIYCIHKIGILFLGDNYEF